MAKKLRSKKASTPKLELLFSLVCDSVANDPNTGKPTLYGVFDVMRPDELTSPIQFHFFSKLFASRGKHSLSISLIGPDNKENKLGEGEVKATKDGIAILQAVLIAKVEKEGRYELQIKSGRKKIGKPCRFELKLKGNKT